MSVITDTQVQEFLIGNESFYRGWLGADVVGSESLTLERLIQLTDESEEVQAHRLQYTALLEQYPELVASPKHLKRTKEIIGHFSGTPNVRRALGARHTAKTFLAQRAE